MENDKKFKDRRKILYTLGIIFLAIGIICIFIAPLEVICFYFFIEGGRFYFEGFNFGSLLFSFIAVQIIGYYIIAAVFIPLGYGHLKLRFWVRRLSLALLWFWMIVGIPLTILFALALAASKGPSLWLVITIMPLMYPVVPAVLIWFYRKKDVELTLKSQDKKTYWLDKIPIPVLVILFLFSFYILTLQVLLLFRGIYPFFGVLLLDLKGAFIISISIMIFLLFFWGLFRLKAWAWWGSVVYFGITTVSFLLTFSIKSLSDIYPLMNFAPLEIEIFRNLPFQGLRLSIFIAVPLLATLAIIIYSKKYFPSKR
jgi:hypothetical protein